MIINQGREAKVKQGTGKGNTNMIGGAELKDQQEDRADRRRAPEKT